ncbi:lipopolysaccharide biosynthesis protein [Amedibacillus sp. YH-ame6]
MKKQIFKGNFGKLASDIIGRGFTEVLGAITSTITFAILARSMIKSDYAVVNQLTTLGVLLAPILLVKMNSAFCVFFAGEPNKEKIKSRFVTICLTIIPIGLLLIGILNGFNDYFSILMFNTPEYGNVMFTMSLYYILLAFSTLFQDFFRAIGDIKVSNFNTTVKNVLKCLILVLAYFFRYEISLEFVLWIHCIIELISIFMILIPLNKYFKDIPFKIEWKPLKKYYIYALPLMPYLILSWVNSQIGKFILNHLMGLNDSAAYTFNYSLVVRLFILNTVLSYTIMPHISKYWNMGDKAMVSSYLTKAFNLGIMIGIPLSFGLISVLPTIVSLLSDGNYVAMPFLCFILCLTMLFNMMFNIFSYLIDLTRKTAWFTFILLITSVINISLNYILIPLWGLNGAGVTILFTSLIQAILTIIIGMKSAKMKLHIKIEYIIRVIVFSLLMYGVVTFIYNDSGLLNFVFSIAIGLGVYFGGFFLYCKMTKRKLL